MHVNHKRVAKGAMLIAALTLVARVAGIAREIAIARRYGVSGVLDAYQISVTITTVVPVMIASIASSVLVPRLVAVRGLGSERKQFLTELNGTILAVAIPMMLLTWLVAPYAAQLLAGTDHADRLRLTIQMSREMAPVAGLTIGVAYFCARLQSRERFAYSITDGVPALAITGLVLLSLDPTDPIPLVIGTLVGSGLQLFVLGWMARKGDPPLASVSLSHKSHEWQSLYGSILLMGLGQLLFAIAAPVDQYFAARVGEGAVATMGYANRVLALLTTFGSVVVTRALLPVFSGSVAEGDHDLARRQCFQWAGLLGIAATGMVVVLWIAAPLLVRLMFERGAFTGKASAEVSTVLKFGLLQLLFFFPGMAFVQFLLSLRKYHVLLAVAAVAICGKIALNFLLVRQLGLTGIMIATATMYALTLGGQALYAKVRL